MDGDMGTYCPVRNRHDHNLHQHYSAKPHHELQYFLGALSMGRKHSLHNLCIYLIHRTSRMHSYADPVHETRTDRILWDTLQHPDTKQAHSLCICLCNLLYSHIRTYRIPKGRRQSMGMGQQIGCGKRLGT